MAPAHHVLVYISGLYESYQLRGRCPRLAMPWGQVIPGSCPSFTQLTELSEAFAQLKFQERLGIFVLHFCRVCLFGLSGV